MYSCVALDMKKGNAELYEGEVKSGRADLTMTMEDGDFVNMVTGKLDGQKVIIFFIFVMMYKELLKRRTLGTQCAFRYGNYHLNL